MFRKFVVLSLCALLCACAGHAPKDTTPIVSLPPPPPPGEPADLAGLDAGALRVAFGEPAFTRKDGPAEMWRYDNSACKAFFFLYSNGTTFTVRHVETLPRGSEMAADANCLAQLRLHTPVS